MVDMLAEQLKGLISPDICDKEIADRFLQRTNKGKLTRDENPETHFCVYFAAYDPVAQEVFVGHHKKSGLWLFNGGHIDEGETPEQALEREINEEWGLQMTSSEIDNPSLLTITPINNPTKQPCRAHYDIWYFVKLRQVNFHPDQVLLAKEFHETKWTSPSEARKLVTDPNTLDAIGKIEQLWK